MTRLILSLALGALWIAASQAQTINVIPAASRTAVRGAAENFTGTAIVEMLFVPGPQNRAGAAQVTFAPGARTVWHRHPTGQNLLVTTGSGWIQEWNGQKRNIAAGDVVWTPPGVKHWHGATSTTVMTHVAIQETVNGTNVEWLEAVSEAQYQRPAADVPNTGATLKQQEDSRVWMTIGERRFAVTLTDNAAARAFAELLPLTLDMPDLNGNEKHVALPKPLPTNAIRPGTIRNGDLMLYGSNTLVVFYLTFDSSYSYTRLGRVDDPSGLAQALGPNTVRIAFSKEAP